jgi:2-desacetyl-2-hydroxyethyl bacteriochlorophyllide A dehydrogenase
MNQIVLQNPGRFELTECAEPVRGPGEALVRVHRLGVCGTDIHAYYGKQPFFTYPRVVGHELGLEVIDPGDAPNGLRRGDRCSLEPYFNCGRCTACRRGKPNCCSEMKVFGVHIDGGMRPVLSVPARRLHKSGKLSYDQLALVETLAIGAHAVERAEVKQGEFVLVIGAGPIGLSVIQFVIARGAAVAVMDVAESRLEFCRRQMGVKHTLQPGPGTPDSLRAIGGGDLPTVVIDATGNSKSMAGAFELPAHGGRIVFVGLFQGDLSFNDPSFHRRELTLLASRNALPGTFRDIIALIEAGRVDTAPWISNRLSLWDVPRRFPDFAGNPAIIKTMIDVSD